jgi:hypothetical protein
MEERSFNRDATISADGITVHQLYTEDEFEVPAVVLKLVSYRAERTRIRLTVPNLEADRIGFHPDFEDDSWTVGDETLTFETELDPDTELTTLYLIESAGQTVPERVLEDCRIASVTSIESDRQQEPASGHAGDASPDQADTLSESEFEPIEDEAGGAAETVDTETAEFSSGSDDSLIDPSGEPLSPDETGADEAVIGADELDQSVDFESPVSSEQETAVDEGASGDEESAEHPTSTGNAVTQETEGTAETTRETQAVGSAESQKQETDMTPNEQEQTDASSLSTDQLIAELRSRLDDDELSPEHRRELGAEFGGEDGARDARITHLQARMSDIETFSSSMEEVLDQHGPPAAVFGEFEDRLETMEAALAEMSEQVDTTAEWQETVEPRLDAVEQDIDEVTEDVTAMEHTVDDLESEVSAIQNWREKVTGALKTFMDD